MKTIKFTLPLIAVICLMMIARFTSAQPDLGDAQQFFPIPLFVSKYSLLFRESTDSEPFEFSAYDWMPGNTLMRRAIPISTDQNNPSSVVLYSHARLGSLFDNDFQWVNPPGLNIDYEITLIFGLSAKAYRYLFNGEETIRIQQDANGPVNYFEVYYDVNRNSDNLGGTGFNDGVLLMRGVFKQDEGSGGFHSLRSCSTASTWLADLDNFVNNDFPGIGSLVGSGAFQGVVAIDASSINSDFFPQANRIFALELRLANQSIAPFYQVNPSRSFWDGTNTLAPQYGVGFGTYDAINGFSYGPSPADLQLQSDMNSMQRATMFLIRDAGRARKFYRRDYYFPFPPP